MSYYIPSEDAACLAFLESLSFYLSATPSEYGIGVPDATNLAALVAAYAAAYDVANRDGSRTKETILIKDQAKAVAVDMARALVNLIKPNMGVSDPAKIRAGIPLPNKSRTPAPVPSTAPALTIVGSVTGSQTLRFRDSVDEARRAKPFGVSALFLYVAVGDGPAASIEQAKFYDSFGKGPIGVEFQSADNGKMATYFARWVNTRHEQGPASVPVSMTIAA